MTIQELREKRNKIVVDARAHLEKHQAAGTFNGDESARFDAMIDESDEIRQMIERMERMEKIELDLRTIDPEKRIQPEGGDGDKAEFRSIRGAGLTAEQHDDAVRNLNNYIRTGERRALEAGLDSAGGYLLPSQQVAAGFLKDVDDLVFIRQRSQVETITQAESLGILTLTDPDDFAWTTELATGSEDSTMAFGKREMRPHPLAKRIKVSRTLLQKATRSPIQLIQERFAYKLAITQEKAFLTGSGTQQPLGVFTASTSGISTSRDVSTDNTTTSMTADGLIGIKYTLKGAYWGNARWLFHRDGVKQIAKLKDGEGQYLFDAPENRLLGIPVDVSEHAPNTFTTGQYVGILANWNMGYRIVDALSMTIQRLDELYAETNQVGFIMRSETDGAPVLEEAFVRVKLA